MFGSDRLSLAQRFAERLADDGVVRGLIGPREVPRLWSRHLLNCAAVAELLPQDVTVADIGAGAGLPGVVLAIARPDLRLALVEPMLRRTTFLQEVVDELGLRGVEVVRARAEELHGERSFDVVTSRAVAPLPRLAAWSMPLVATDGAMVALKGDRASSEAGEATAELRAHGCSVPEVLSCGADLLPEPTHAVRVRWAGEPRVSWRPGPVRSPRTTGRNPRSRRADPRARKRS